MKHLIGRKRANQRRSLAFSENQNETQFCRVSSATEGNDIEVFSWKRFAQ